MNSVQSFFECGFTYFHCHFNEQEYVGNDGDFFLFLTNVGAPEHQIIEIDIRTKKPKKYCDVVIPVSELFLSISI